MFGVATDTLDADGAVLWREPMPFTEAELEAVLPRFVGAVLQVPRWCRRCGSGAPPP